MDRRALTAAFLLFGPACFTQGDTLNTVIPCGPAGPGERYSGLIFFEQVFSTAIASNYDGAAGPIRFSGIGIEAADNYDLTKHFGSYYTIGLRHVGYISEKSDLERRAKYRTWNLSLGAGLKLGRMQHGLFFLGYSIELPFHYRERFFLDKEQEEIMGEWFSRRTPTLSHAIVAGYQFPFGVSVKGMFYLSRFHRVDFTALDDGTTTHPYAGMDNHLVSLSIQFLLLQQPEAILHEPRPK